jgi:hypothetical protein
MSEYPTPAPEADVAQHGYRTTETWTVASQLSNDEASYHHAQALIEQAGNYFAAAGALQEYVEEGNPLAGEDTLYSALLAHAIAMVNWDELAEALAPEHWNAGENRSEDDLRRFLEEPDSRGEGEPRP